MLIYIKCELKSNIYLFAVQFLSQYSSVFFVIQLILLFMFGGTPQKLTIVLNYFALFWENSVSKNVQNCSLCG